MLARQRKQPVRPQGLPAAGGPRLFGRARVDEFAFDIEVLVLARRLGMAVAEVPVQAQQRAGSTVHLLGNSRRMLSEIWALRRTAATEHALPASAA